MQTFQYQSLAANGQQRNGVLTAVDRADAVRQLMSRGETATSLVVSENGVSANGVALNGHAKAHATAASSAATVTPLQAFRRAKPSLRRPETANLMRELATALEAGLPLMQALKTVRRQAPGRALPIVLDHLIARVEAGDPLHTAAREYGPPFDDMILGMLRAADASGEMSKVLHQLADLLERSIELRREVMGATFYPLLIAILLAGSVTVLVTVLIPNLIGPLADQAGFTMPWPTQLLLNIANFLAAAWPYIILLAVAVVFAWRAWVKSPANRFRLDLFKLKLPLVGRLLRDVAVARFTRTLGTLTAAGLPLLDALRITNGTLNNAALMKAIDDVQQQVTSGKSLADPLERSGLFPPLLVQVVNLGERSGRLETMLLHAATAFDRQVNASLKLVTKALPPFLLIIMATVGAFVLASILLPLLELQSLVK